MKIGKHMAEAGKGKTIVEQNMSTRERQNYEGDESMCWTWPGFPEYRFESSSPCAGIVGPFGGC